MDWSELGPVPDDEATNRHIVLIREQWDALKESHESAQARSMLSDLPVCDHDLIFVRVLCAGGSTQLRKQCRRCFWVQPMSIKFAECPDPVDSLPLRITLDWNRVWSARSDMREEVVEPIPAHSGTYRSHLLSDKWRQTRQRVMQRAGGMCEGCLIEPATEVHHMNYLTLGDELCYDLRALCPACHDKADNIRKRR